MHPTERSPNATTSRPRAWSWALVLVLLVAAAACSSTSAQTSPSDDTAAADDAVTDSVDEADAATPVEATETTDTSDTSDTTETAGPTGTEPTASNGDGSCPSDAFLVDEVNAYEQSDGYDDPYLDVSCTDDSLVVNTNGMINYEFVPMTPNDLSANDVTYEIPLDPEWSDTPASLQTGPIGVAVNGVAIFGPFEAPFDGYGDPVTDGLLDFCNGHTQQQGVYHYHAAPDCVVDLTQPGTVVGYLNDGYSILSPYVCADDTCTEVVELQSSYVRVDDSTSGAFESWEYVEGSGDLDECNGTVGADGEYHYYATDEFPYLAFCYHGVTDAGGGTFTGDAPDDGAATGAGPGGGTGLPAGDRPRRG